MTRTDIKQQIFVVDFWTEADELIIQYRQGDDDKDLALDKYDAYPLLEAVGVIEAGHKDGSFLLHDEDGHVRKYEWEYLPKLSQSDAINIVTEHLDREQTRKYINSFTTTKAV